MFIPVTKEAQPYVLLSDREAAVKTVWRLMPMDAEESAAYRARWRQVDAEFGVSSQARAREAIKVDRQQLQKKLEGANNCFAEDDDVTGEALVGAIDQLDFPSLQELLTACQNMAQLRAGGKN